LRGPQRATEYPAPQPDAELPAGELAVTEGVQNFLNAAAQLGRTCTPWSSSARSSARKLRRKATNPGATAPPSGQGIVVCADRTISRR